MLIHSMLYILPDPPPEDEPDAKFMLSSPVGNVGPLSFSDAHELMFVTVLREAFKQEELQVKHADASH